jgi:hypothetical protein
MEALRKLPTINDIVQLDDGEVSLTEAGGKYNLRVYGPMLTEEGTIVVQTKESQVTMVEFRLVELFLGTNGRTTQELIDFVLEVQTFLNKFGLGSRKPNLSLDHRRTEL